MIHLTIQQLSTYFDGELGDSSAELVRQHFGTCEECATRYAKLETQGTALAEALARDPDDAFLERLTKEIEERVRPDRSKADAARSAAKTEAARPAPKVEAPRPVPKAYAARPVPRVDAARPVPRVDTARPVPRVDAARPAPKGDAPRPTPRADGPAAPAARASSAARTAPQDEGPSAPVASPVRPARARYPVRRSGHPVPWAVAVLLILVVVSGSVVISRMGEMAQAPESAPAGAPVTAGTALPPLQPEPAPGPAEASLPPDAEPVDVVSPARDSGRRPPEPARARAAGKVDRLKDDLESAVPPDSPALSPAADAPPRLEGASPSAADYDAAAIHWEETLPSLRGEEYRATRLRLAQARYRAWDLSPNSDRAAAAGAAIRAYLVTAPQSPERDEAARWLSRVEEAGFR